jgi:carbamoyl-phosphate synthase small subunit
MNAKLILKNGTEFCGISFGSEKASSGEVVFNTGMVGYAESLTDPSYTGQILTLTYPLIGNYGVPGKKETNEILNHFESNKIHVKGLIISDYSHNYSHWNAAQSLGDWLKEEDIPALYGIDTRKLTKILREKGTMLGKIVFDDNNDESNGKRNNEKEFVSNDNNDDDENFTSNTKSSNKTEEFYNPNDKDIVKDITIKKPKIYNDKPGQKRLILIDCGVKNNIIRNFIKRDISVIRVPYDYDFFSLDFDGIFISNGPGNPEMCTQTIANVKQALEKNIPTFGICLGSQILALAAGGRTFKLKYGHRSQNQPCILTGTKRCFITTQNHGFAVDMSTLGEEWEEWFVNANDGTNEGIKHKTKPFLGIQAHPEHNPGPVDIEFIFDDFIQLMEEKNVKPKKVLVVGSSALKIGEAGESSRKKN